MGCFTRSTFPPLLSPSFLLLSLFFLLPYTLTPFLSLSFRPSSPSSFTGPSLPISLSHTFFFTPSPPLFLTLFPRATWFAAVSTSSIDFGLDTTDRLIIGTQPLVQCLFLALNFFNMLLQVFYSRANFSLLCFVG